MQQDITQQAPGIGPLLVVLSVGVTAAIWVIAGIVIGGVFVAMYVGFGFANGFRYTTRQLVDNVIGPDKNRTI